MKPAVTKRFSPELEAELRYRIEDLDHGDDDAPSREDVLQQLMQDCDNPEHVASEFKRELDDFGIEIGVYRETTIEEMARRVVMGRCRKKYDFKRGGRFYVFESWKPLVGPDVTVLDEITELEKQLTSALKVWKRTRSNWSQVESITNSIERLKKGVA